MDTNFATRIIGYGFGIFALFIFIYSFFYSGESALKEQAIFWFYSALIASLIPHIKQFKYKDLEVQFRENFQKLEKDVGKKIERVEHTVAEKFAEYLDTLPDEQQLSRQDEITRRHLYRARMTLPELKSLLIKAGYFNGNVDDEFTSILVSSIKDFQTKNNLTIDGIAGNLTILKLREVLTNKNTE